MGTLILPPSGSVYIEANTVIYAVEKIEPYSSFLIPLWSAARNEQISLITSELTWLEALTKPMRDGNAPLETLFRAFLMASEVRMIPATLDTWEEATKLRRLGLKTPDSLHAATGLLSGCSLFLTNDAIFTRVPNLPVLLLSLAIAV